MAGTDLTHTDCGFEAVYLPPPPAAQSPDSLQAAPLSDAAGGGGLPAARGLRRAILGGVASLDGVGKQLCLESASAVWAAGKHDVRPNQGKVLHWASVLCNQTNHRCVIPPSR